jgi:hypothetical protein
MNTVAGTEVLVCRRCGTRFRRPRVFDREYCPACTDYMHAQDEDRACRMRVLPDSWGDERDDDTVRMIEAREHSDAFDDGDGEAA